MASAASPKDIELKTVPQDKVADPNSIVADVEGQPREASAAADEQRNAPQPRVPDPDAIVAVAEEDPPRALPNVPAAEEIQRGRLHRVWYDFLYSDKSASAVTTLHLYGYFLSLMMLLWGSNEFRQFGRKESLFFKAAFQLFGFTFSLLGVRACYTGQTKQLCIFFAYQLTQTFLTFFGMLYMLRTSREELFHDFITEPFYNLKLVDHPYGHAITEIDMSAEPAYEISLLHFRAFYMLIVTTENCGTNRREPGSNGELYIDGVPMGRYLEIGPTHGEGQPTAVQRNFIDKVGLLFGA